MNYPKTTDNTLVLRGTQIVLPDALQNQAIRLARERHQGLVGTKKQLVREKVWFAWDWFAGLTPHKRVAAMPGEHPQADGRATQNVQPAQQFLERS